MFFYSMSVSSLWTRVLVGCLGNGHMTILRKESGSSHSKGKSQGHSGQADKVQ